MGFPPNDRQNVPGPRAPRMGGPATPEDTGLTGDTSGVNFSNPASSGLGGPVSRSQLPQGRNYNPLPPMDLGITQTPAQPPTRNYAPVQTPDYGSMMGSMPSMPQPGITRHNLFQNPLTQTPFQSLLHSLLGRG